MSCAPYTPCHEPTCNECNPVNPCYDNCGCLNPTTFDCVTNFKQNYPHIPLNVNQTGSDLLTQLNTTINGLKENQFKVKSDDADTCPDSLFDKLEAAGDVSFSIVGTGCNRKLRINSTASGNPVDQNVKVSGTDTTANFLGAKIVDGTYVKKTTLNGGGNEQLRFDITVSDLISGDSGNQLTQGVDGKLKTSFSAPDGSETKVTIAQNQGLTISGTGTLANPYVIGTYGNNFPTRTYFDGAWRNLTFTNASASNITVSSQSVQFRYRGDGSIEFRGSVTYSVQFDGTTGNKRIINGASFPLNGNNNVSSAEVNRVVNLKNYMTFDVPTTIPSTPNITGYNVNMLAAAPNQNANIQLEFMHNTAATKSIVITMDGAIYHPNI
jgi:hypothetical protein